MVCQYMRKHQDYRYACLRSTYFDPNGKESLLATNERYGKPFKLPTLYQHMKRHQKRDIERSERLAEITGEPSKTWQRKTVKTELIRAEKKKELEKVEDVIQNTETVIDAPLSRRQQYEIGLDEFIALGRDRLKHNEMAISAANFIAAVKVKADIERTTKDRRLEMLRSMFSGAAPKKVEDESQNSNGPGLLNQG
jgi:5-hydroxyisourate hydrolase-like protein (transthyretin family)